MTISKEAIDAVGNAFAEIHEWRMAERNVVRMLEAALPFLPIAGVGKVKALEDLRLAAASIREWMPETLPADEQGKVHFARALAESAAEAIEAFLSQSEHLSALTSSPGKDGGQEVEAVSVEGSPLLEWAVDQWKRQVGGRPLRNVHRRSLDDVWRQVIRWAGGDPDKLVGPPHDELLAMESKR